MKVYSSKRHGNRFKFDLREVEAKDLENSEINFSNITNNNSTNVSCVGEIIWQFVDIKEHF
jgi:hypothetical protein